MIRTSNLRKEYDGHVALENLTLEVGRGDVFGLIGPNGAGKTTLLRILSTLETPTFGTVTIDGVDIEEEPKKIHRLIGFMPDFHHAYEEMTVREYIEYFAAAHKIEPATRAKRVRHILDMTQLSVKETDGIRGLSRGMKQRLCLGRTLIHDPALLLLDEPTSGLDPRARLEFRAVVKTLAAEGKTIVISSHILEDLADFCNAVGILEKGRLVEAGRIATIAARMQKATRIRVRALGETGRAAAILKDHPLVSSVEVSGERIDLAFRGDAEGQARLLAQLVAAGIPIASFEERRAGLEEIFLEGSTQEVS